MSDVHSVLFDRRYYHDKAAKKWLYKNNLVPIKPVHITAHYLRYRIVDPKYFKSFMTKQISPTIKLVIGFY